MFTVSANHSRVLIENRIRELEDKKDHLLSKRSLLDTNKRGLSLERENLSKVAAELAGKLNELLQNAQKIIREWTPKPMSFQHLFLESCPTAKVPESTQKIINRVFSTDEIVFCILKSINEVNLQRYARVSTCFSRVCRSRETSLLVIAAAQPEQPQLFVSINDDVFLYNQAKALAQMDYLKSVLPSLIQMRDNIQRSRKTYEELIIVISGLSAGILTLAAFSRLSSAQLLELRREWSSY